MHSGALSTCSSGPVDWQNIGPADSAQRGEASNQSVGQNSEISESDDGTLGTWQGSKSARSGGPSDQQNGRTSR
jgi:hypothetical protein